MAQDSGYEMRIVLINGRVLQFMPHELRGFLTSPPLGLALVAILVLLIAVDPHVFPNPVNVFSRIAFWAMGIATYFCVMILVSAVANSIVRMFGLRSVYLPFVDIPIIVIATIIGAYIGGLFLENGDARLELAPLDFVRNFLLAQGLQFVLVNWGFTDYLRRVRAKENRTSGSSGATSPRSQRSVSANGRTILIDQLIYMESKQHYVEIKTLTGGLTVRSTLKSLMGQLDDADGVQVHRSFWVSAWALSRMSGGAEKRIVHLFDGSTLPVSRPRAAAVERWFNAHRNEEDVGG